jgi:uncharacterized membrane protein
MVQLTIYLVCVVLVIIGSLSLVAAMSVDGKYRSFLACLFACVPIAIGIWLFQISGLKINDFPRLFKETSQEIERVAKIIKDGVANRNDFEKMTKGM